jgi:uroporphyrinogen-III decarboxylase
MNVTVRELVQSSDLMAHAMQIVAHKTSSAAAVSLMDLSVEAEAFGAKVRFADHEVPAVVERLVEDEDEALDELHSRREFYGWFECDVANSIADKLDVQLIGY